MHKKVKVYTTRNADELVALLNIDPADFVGMEIRAKLNKKIIDTVKSKKLTHADVAVKAKASRTRVAAILNGNTRGMSTDLLIRILYSLGYKTKVSFSPARIAA
jgi:predicted XRE-type DNA-binding protein